METTSHTSDPLAGIATSKIAATRAVFVEADDDDLLRSHAGWSKAAAQATNTYRQARTIAAIVHIAAQEIAARGLQLSE